MPIACRQRLAGDDEEEQHCAGNDHASRGEPPCLRRVETSRQDQKDR
jgi:hypothetical protein